VTSCDAGYCHVVRHTAVTPGTDGSHCVYWLVTGVDEVSRERSAMRHRRSGCITAVRSCNATRVDNFVTHSPDCIRQPRHTGILHPTPIVRRSLATARFIWSAKKSGQAVQPESRVVLAVP